MSETAYPVTTITGNPNAARQGNGPPLIPNAAHVTRIPQAPNPVMVTYGAPPVPTPDDIEHDRVARLRPADKSARAIRAALANLAEDAVAARTRASAWQRRADDVLQDGGSIADIQAARSKAAAAEVEVEQLAAMEGSLRTSLARAEAEETAELEALARRVPLAKQAVEAWRKFAEQRYPKLAKELAEGLALEEVAERAMQTIQIAAIRIPDVMVPAPLPLVQFGQRTESYRQRASLPGTDVRPVAKWSVLPAGVQY